MNWLDSYIGLTLTFRWIGVTRNVGDAVLNDVAEHLQVTKELLVVKKHIIDTRLEPYSKLSRLRNQIRKFWLENSVPTLDKGVRLILATDAQRISKGFQDYLEDWNDAVQAFDRIWDQVLQDIARKLGPLYDPKDYRLRPPELFSFVWEFVNIRFPNELLSPIFEEEYRKFLRKMEATQLAIKQAFAEELRDLTAHLIERLTPSGGEIKRFKKNTIENFREFFAKFHHLNVMNDPELDQLIRQAERIIGSVDAETLRENQNIAAVIKEEMTKIKDALDQQIQTVSESKRKLWV
jgi:hypothetical protein